MFFDSNAELDQLPDDDTETPSKEAEPIYSQAGLQPLDELAFHVDDAMQTKAMLEEADGLAIQRPALQERYIAELEQAGTKVTEALHMAREQASPVALPMSGDRPAGFADRVEAGRGDIALA